MTSGIDHSVRKTGEFAHLSSAYRSYSEADQTPYSVIFVSLFIVAGLFSPQRSAALEQSLGDIAVVVRPAAWTSALEQWKAYRETQGYRIVEVDADQGREAIQRSIRQAALQSPGSVKFVLLAGDVQSPSLLSIHVPTFYRESKAMVQFGGERQIATDLPYGDLDGDEVPELAVGRIPADTPGELTSVLSRVIELERQRDFSIWRRDVHIVAGVGGFGMLADSVIEMTTRRFLAERIPGWSNLSMTQASTQSLYCPDPFKFSETCLDRLNQGGLFWVYIGHGQVTALDYLKVEDEFLPIMTSDQLSQVRSGVKSPIAVFLACYTGAFDARDDSFAEKLILGDRGPVASIAASRVSGPYGLAMLANGMLEAYFERQERTLGEVMLFAKQSLLAELPASNQAENSGTKPEEKNEDQQLQMITSIANALSPDGYDLAMERLEHAWQMNLLGDPLLQLRYPRLIELDIPEVVAPGEVVVMKGASYAGGLLRVEFGRRRGEVSKATKSTQVGIDSSDGREQYQQRYAEANEPIIFASEFVDCAPGSFSCEITIPEETARGSYMVRVFSESSDGWEAGYAELKVRPVDKKSKGN